MFSSRVFLFLATLGLIAALTVPVPVVAQTVIYVDDDASGSGDGSESNPFSTLQAALSEARQRLDQESEPNADEIRIAEGMYYPDEGSNVTDDDPSESFALTLEIPLKGGYTSDFSSRDLETHVTVLSGDIDQNDTTNENGVVTDTADISGTNSYHVVSTPFETPVTLSGLTITAGQANESEFDSGGGITTDTILTLRDVQIAGNTANDNGGGIHVDPGSLSVENSMLRANAASSGGAVHVTTGGLRLSGVTVQNNAGGGVVGVGDGPASEIAYAELTDVTFAGNTGNGGLNLETSTSLTLRSVTFENNSDTGASGGGANLTLDDARAHLIDLTFRENTAIDTTGEENSGGGGLAVSTGFDTDLTLQRSRFVGNEATTTTSTNFTSTQGSGGALHCRGSISVSNTTFRNNTAESDGGGVFLYAFSGTELDGVLFEDNQAGREGGGMLASSFKGTLSDAVFRDNSSGGRRSQSGGGGLIVDEFSSPTLENVRFVNNVSEADAGGLLVDDNTTTELKNVDFFGNEARLLQGGAVLVNDGTLISANTEFRENESPESIVKALGGSLELTNAVVADNVIRDTSFTVEEKGVVFAKTTSATLANVVVASNDGTGLNNESTESFGSTFPSTLTVHNSIVYQNETEIDTSDEAGGTFNVQNTLVEGGLPSGVSDNGGNISGDPMFADPSNGDYHLQSGSPAVDAGNDSLIPDDTLDLDADGDSSEAVPYDLDQNARTEGTVDLGPYEAGSGPPQFAKSLSSGASEAGLPKRFGANLTFQTLSTSTDLTVTYDGSASTEGLGLPGTQGLAVTALWTIEFSPEPAASDIDATVCFDIGDLSFPVVDRSALNVYARSGPSATDWQKRTPTELRPNAENPKQVCATGQSSFSQFAVTAKKSELPVELAQFEAQTDEGTVVLSWKTASETNNAGFEVQHRAAEQEAWGKVGSVEGAGTTDQPQSYRFSVEADLSSGTHHFRLRQVDIDGTAHLSDVVTVDLQMQQPVRLTAPAPNPVSGRATLSFAVKTSVETTLRLYNVLGQQVATLYRGTPAAGESQTVDLSAGNLSSGAYFLRLQAGERSQTQRLTIVR
jgi:hypothetical protein